jgi:ribonuclease J
MSCQSTESGATCELARLTGVPNENVVLADDGVVVDLFEGVARIVGKVPCGFVYVDGTSVGDITEASLKDRRILGEEGFISIVVAIDATTGRIVAGPDIHARGFAEDEGVFDEVKERVIRDLASAVADGITDTHQLAQIVRRTVGQWVNSAHRRRPMILPLVVEV